MLAGMIWASRTFPRDGWYDVQAQFEDGYDAADCPVDRLLCRTESHGRTTIYVGVTDPGLLDAYEGFNRCPEPGGMVKPLLLMGSEQTFDNLFHRRRETRDRTD